LQSDQFLLQSEFRHHGETEPRGARRLFLMAHFKGQIIVEDFGFYERDADAVCEIRAPDAAHDGVERVRERDDGVGAALTCLRPRASAEVRDGAVNLVEIFHDSRAMADESSAIASSLSRFLCATVF
jgi:hypothetical protein